MDKEEYWFRLWVDTEFVAMRAGFLRRQGWEDEEPDTTLYDFTTLRKLYQLELWERMIDKVIVKKSGKPFKNKYKEATILNVVPHFIHGEPAFTFKEFDGMVACCQCKLKD